MCHTQKQILVKFVISTYLFFIDILNKKVWTRYKNTKCAQQKGNISCLNLNYFIIKVLQIFL